MGDGEHMVEMRGITKRFPGIVANDKVDFELRRGEIHALLGENGAGKSTLMNILAGLYRADAGSMLIKGAPQTFTAPRQAIQAGIGMIHQHFMLVPSQTVTENILIGLPQPRLRLNLGTYEREIGELSKRFGLRVDPRAHIWQLSVGEQQRVEILKMLYRGADVLIMDEPTAVLAPQEIDGLFETLRAITAQGRSIVFISHKLQEVTALADRVTVLRRGRVTAAGIPTRDTTRKDLARLMVGRDVVLMVEKAPSVPGPVVLSVQHVSTVNDRGLPAVQDVSLEVRAGEIVGLAGVAGNGQRELAEVIAGLRRATGGQVQLKGQRISNEPASTAIRSGLAHVPEDRNHVGSAPNLTVVDNLIMKSYRRRPILKGWRIDAGAATRFAQDLIDRYSIRTASLRTQARLLSGGNLQRLILAREIAADPVCILAMQPTQGLDVGAIETVHRLLLQQRTAGVATLLISEELEELLALSDRICVMYEGRIVGAVDDRDVEQIGMLMTGMEAA
jgi:simple sugar transport system ATP-binding protein